MEGAFRHPAAWSLKEPESDREELQLVINGQLHDWSMLFHRTADRAVLSGGSAVIDGEEQPLATLPCTGTG